jgi:hypothetical protein
MKKQKTPKYTVWVWEYLTCCGGLWNPKYKAANYREALRIACDGVKLFRGSWKLDTGMCLMRQKLYLSVRHIEENKSMVSITREP